MTVTEPAPAKVEVSVSWTTMAKVVAFVLLVTVVGKLLPLLGMVAIALFIAITMAPLAEGAIKRGAPKWLGVSTCAVILLGSVGAFLFFVIPLAGSQLGTLIKALPSFKEHVLKGLASSGWAHDVASGLLASPAFNDPAPLMNQLWNWGTVALESMVQFILILIIAVYFLSDGKRVYEWLLAFLPARQRQRVAQAVPEIEAIIFSYMGGQLVTSVLCAGYVFTVLTLLHVPNAVLLAVMAGIFDVLPIVGFFLAVIPAAAMALAVSPTACLMTIGLYTLYHFLENYLLVPWVYGNRLRLSGLTVFLSCLAAGMVAGIIGVIAVLPLIASFPIIERIWLRPVLGPATVDTHEEILEREHPGMEPG